MGNEVWVLRGEWYCFYYGGWVVTGVIDLLVSFLFPSGWLVLFWGFNSNERFG
jgi:hypothetical protein